MKILELCLAPNLGGLELYFHRCRLWFSKNGFETFSAVAPDSRLSMLMDPEDQIIVERGKKWYPAKAANLLKRLVDENHVDIIHIHHADDIALGAMIKRKSTRKVHLVHTRQMLLPHSKKDLYHRWIYAPYDLILTITDQLKVAAQQRLPVPGDRIQRLYYGVDSPVSISTEQCEKITSNNTFNIAILSRIEFPKGQHVAIEALKILSSRGLSANVYFYGDVMDEQYYQELRSIIEEGELNDYVYFMGFQKQANKILGCYDCVILPSKGETFGLVLAEAMRAETAVVGTNAGGVLEIIDNEETGLLFDFDNPSTLADAIQELIGNPDKRKALAAAGKHKADTVFNTDKHFAELTSIFESLTGNK